MTAPKTLLLLLALLLGTSAAFAQDNEPFVFFDGKFEQLQQRAQNAQKPFFVYFYANWSAPSKEMNEKTFRNKYLVEYADKYYLGMAVDAESVITEGKQLADTYKVIYMPTIIIFSPNGKELQRMHGQKTPAQVLEVLRKHQNSKASPDEDDITELAKPYTAKDGEFLFKMSVERQPYEGFGIQMGVFSNYRNAFVQLLELQEKYHHRNVLVHVMEKGEESWFKLILGPFATEEDAKAFAALIKRNQKLNGIVVELTALE